MWLLLGRRGVHVAHRSGSKGVHVAGMRGFYSVGGALITEDVENGDRQRVVEGGLTEDQIVQERL